MTEAIATSELQSLFVPFQGEESEENWLVRERGINRLRTLIDGDVIALYHDTFMNGIKILMDGIIKSLTSLRTALTLATCGLIKDLSMRLGSSIDPFADNLLVNLIKMAASTKKIVGQAASNAANALLSKTSYHSRHVLQVWYTMEEKNIQLRIFAIGYVRTLLLTHFDRRDAMERTGGAESLEKCVKKGLTDANPNVREGCRSVFWIFYQTFPERGEKLLKNLEPAVKKLVERDRPKDMVPAATPPPPSPSNSNSTNNSSSTVTKKTRRNSFGSSKSKRMPSPLKSEHENNSLANKQSKSPTTLRAKSPAPPPMTRSKSSSGAINLSPQHNDSPPLPPKSPTPTRANVLTKRASVAQFPKVQIRKLSVMEQLEHNDWKIRIDGLNNLVSLAIKRSSESNTGKHNEFKRSPLPSDDDLKPVIFKLINDSSPKVIECLLSANNVVEIAKIVKIEHFILKVLLIASDDDKTEQSVTVQACLPEMKHTIGKENSLAALSKCFLILGSPGTSPKKLAAGLGFSPPQRRKIIHGLLTWINEIIEPKLEEAEINDGAIGGFLGDPDKYKLLVNRVIPMVLTTKENSENFNPLSNLLINLHKLNPDLFESVLFTFDSKTVDAVGNMVGWEDEFEEESEENERDEHELEQEAEYQHELQLKRQKENYLQQQLEREKEIEYEHELELRQQEEYELSQQQYEAQYKREMEFRKQKEFELQHELEREAQYKREMELRQQKEFELQQQHELEYEAQYKREMELRQQKEFELQQQRELEHEAQYKREMELRQQKEFELQQQRELEREAQYKREFELRQQKELELQQQHGLEREAQYKKEMELRQQKEFELEQQREFKHEAQYKGEMELKQQKEFEPQQHELEREAQYKREMEIRQQKESEFQQQHELEHEAQYKQEMESKQQKELELQQQHELEREVQYKKEMELRQQKEFELQQQHELEHETRYKKEMELRQQKVFELQQQRELEHEAQYKREMELKQQKELELQQNELEREAQYKREMEIKQQKESELLQQHQEEEHELPSRQQKELEQQQLHEQGKELEYQQELELRKQEEYESQQHREAQYKREMELRQQKEFELQQQHGIEAKERQQREAQYKREMELRQQKEYELQQQRELEREAHYKRDIELRQKKEREFESRQQKEFEQQQQREAQYKREMELRQKKEYELQKQQHEHDAQYKREFELRQQKEFELEAHYKREFELRNQKEFDEYDDTISEFDLNQSEKSSTRDGTVVSKPVNRIVSLPPPSHELGIPDFDEINSDLENINEIVKKLDMEEEELIEENISGDLGEIAANRATSIIITEDTWAQLSNTLNGNLNNPFYTDPEKRFKIEDDNNNDTKIKQPFSAAPLNMKNRPLNLSLEQRIEKIDEKDEKLIPVNDNNNMNVENQSSTNSPIIKNNIDSRFDIAPSSPDSSARNGSSTPGARDRAIKMSERFGLDSPLPTSAQEKKLILVTLLARLSNNEVDVCLFRKLIQFSRESPLSDQELAKDIWENGERFNELMNSLIGFFSESDQQNLELKGNALELLQQLIINQSGYLKSFERDVLHVLLECHSEQSSILSNQIEEIMDEYVRIVDTQMGLYALIDIMETNLFMNNFGGNQSPQLQAVNNSNGIKGSAFIVLSKLVRRFDKKSLERQVGRVVPLAIKGFNDTKPEIRKAVVDAIVAIYSVIGDDKTFFQYLGSLSPSQKNLLNYYFDKTTKQHKITQISTKGVQI
nr:11501_t:CDS:10 [Entrophospora candida]